MPATITGFKKFIEETKVDEIVEEIRSGLKAKNDGKMPVFSDLIKSDNGNEYQYVNYVQEGGGVLGVGLVGYTYVLEKLGIRFLKLAGTSAGAINTMMLAACDVKNYHDVEEKIGEKFTCQSEIILYELLNKNLWDMVDGAKFAKYLIGVFLRRKNFFKNLFKFILYAVIISLIAAIFLSVIRLIDPHFNNATETLFKFSKWIAIGGLISIGVLASLYFTIRYYMGRFVNAGYGINPGNNFKQWITSIINRNGIYTSADLEKKMGERCCDMNLRPERIAQQIEGDNARVGPPYLSIIASEITNQRKVDFPSMAKYYWKDEKSVNPADFVRASMSIPIFFSPFCVQLTQPPSDDEGRMLLQNVTEEVSESNPKEIRFVDGGILSNFPINVFHNPSILIARIPTFGVKLEDEKHEKQGEDQVEKMSLGSFLGSIFSTVRFYYDRDFLLKNNIYEKCIGHIDVEKFNWLNFSISNEDKQQLFIQGALAAKVFFLGGDIWVDGKLKKFEAFDWELFKIDRTKLIKTPAK